MFKKAAQKKRKCYVHEILTGCILANPEAASYILKLEL